MSYGVLFGCNCVEFFSLRRLGYGLKIRLVSLKKTRIIHSKQLTQSASEQLLRCQSFINLRN